MAESYVVIDAGSGATWYHGTNGAGTAWDGLSLGTITTLTLKGGEIKGCESVGSNINTGELYYRIYKQGCTAPAWGSAVDIEFNHDYTGSYCGAGDEVKVNKTDYTTNILPSEDGDYYIEFLWHFEDNSGGSWDKQGGIQGCGSCNSFSSNNGLKASFTKGTGGDGTLTANTGTVNWSNTASWPTSALPTVDDYVTIPSSCTMTLNQDDEIGALKIESGGTLIFESGAGRTLTINGDGCASNTIEFVSGGTFTRNDGKIVLDNASGSSIAGTGDLDLNDVVVDNGPVDFNAHNVHGILEILSGGSVSDPPLYESGSTLYYNTGGSYGRNNEWSATSGEGYPYNVHVGTGVTLDLGNGGSGTARQCAGDLTLDGTLTMASTAMTARLTVKGNIAVNATGSFTLSSSGGGDLNAEGNFANDGTFTPNSRTVSLTGSGTQTISGGFTGSEAFDQLDVWNTSSSTGVSLAADIQIDNELRFKDGYLICNAYEVTYNSGATTSGTFTPSDASHIVTNSTGYCEKKGVGATYFEFPVGPAVNTYRPHHIRMDSGSDDFTVRVEDKVYANGSSGSEGSDGVVDLTWFVTSSGGNNSHFKSYWKTTDELGSFDRANCYHRHWNGASWDNLEGANPATASGSYYYQERLNYWDGYSPFIVGDANFAVLPVELMQFSGIQTIDGIRLTWSTASESNNAYFLIERSYDGMYFETIGEVEGNGTRSEVARYQFTDAVSICQEEVVYYRLVQVDYDGQSQIHPEIAVLCYETAQPIIKVVNRPEGDLWITWSGIPLDQVSIKIVNATGQEVLRLNDVPANKGHHVLRNTTTLSDGFYFVQLLTGSIQITQPVSIVR